MATTPTISDAEWEVMRVVWETSPITANEVVARLASRRGWVPATVRTMLNRLVRKGAITFEREGKRYLYRPSVSQSQCVRFESRSFLDRVFGGVAGSLLNHFVRHTKLSRREIDELKRILDRMEQ
ncbi:MAG: BlaI/MecI/CopY family transcriptional regulator [Planctomycetota bacterium]|nr:BlaI/MecI/CopY family transcriptional regulator [Planctomycetota bacterium]